MLEYGEGKELWSKLRFRAKGMVGLRPSLAKFYAAQILNGLEYVWSKGIVHRDVKPENVMVCPVPGTNGAAEVLKLIDFGTARDASAEIDGEKVPHFVGTPEYMSPEAVESKPATSASDVWALGNTLFQLNAGRLPFKAGSPYLTFLSIKALDYIPPDYFSDDLKSIVGAMLQTAPEDRLDAEGIKAHSYFSDVDFASLLTPEGCTLPPPTAREVALEALVARHWKLTSTGAVKCVEPCDGRFAEGVLPVAERSELMGYLDQRGWLGLPQVYPAFFPSRQAAKFHRSAHRRYLGLSQSSEGKFSRAFAVVHAGRACSQSEHSLAGLTAIARRCNALEPTPKLFIVTGEFGAAAHVHRLQTSLSVLRDSIPIVCCPGVEEVGSSVTPESIAWYKERFGDDYYSFYRSGVYFIVVNSPLLCVLGECGSADGTRELAEAHAAWLEKELMTGKLCAVHVAVVSHHKWLGEGDGCVPRALQDRFLRLFHESGVRVVVSASSGHDHEATATSHGGQTGNELEQDFKQVASGRVSVDGSQDGAHFRVLRFLCDSVVVDAYTDRTLPRWLSLAEAGSTNGFDGIDDDDDDDSDEDSDDSFSTDTEDEGE